MFSRLALRLSVSFSIRIYRFVLHLADLYMAAQLLHDFATPFELFTRLANVNTDVLAIGIDLGRQASSESGNTPFESFYLYWFGSTGVGREYENTVSAMLSFSIWFDRRRAIAHLSV